MDVQPARVRIVGEPAVLWDRELRRRLRAAVDRATVTAHPVAHAAQAVQGATVQLAPPGRADVEQQVAALADGVRQHADQLAHALPGGFVTMVAPGAGEGLARLPGDRHAVHLDPALRLPLLRGLDVPAVVQVQAVVEQHARLQLADGPVEPRAVPLVTALGVAAAAGIAEVAPQHVDPAELREQLAHLAVQVLDVAALIARAVHRLALRVVALRVDVVDHEVGVVPVDQRVVEADPQPSAAEGVHHRMQQVLAVRRARGLVIGERAVPQAEALVMLAGDHEVAHAGAGGGVRPHAGIVEVGIEAVEVPLVDLVRDLLLVLDPLVPGRQRVQPPVDEHAEAVVHEPRRVPGARSDRGSAHVATS